MKPRLRRLRQLRAMTRTKPICLSTALPLKLFVERIQLRDKHSQPLGPVETHAALVQLRDARPGLTLQGTTRP